MFIDFLWSQSILIAQISADVFYIYIYIRYIADIVVLCECSDLPHSFCPWCPPEQRDMMWQHQDTLGALDRSHRLSVATLAMPQETGWAQKAKNSQMLWWRLLLLLCHSMSWFTLCSDFLEMLLFSIQKWFIAANTWSWTQKGKQERLFSLWTELNWSEGESFKSFNTVRWEKASSEDLGDCRGCSECQTQMLKCTF